MFTIILLVAYFAFLFAVLGRKMAQDNWGRKA